LPFHTLADARSKVIEELKFYIANDKKMVMGLQREIAIFERRLATLKSLDEKKRNQSNPPQ
jgi:peroxiredoxin